MVAAGHQSSIACAPPHVGLPADVLDGFGVVFPAHLEVPTESGRVTVRPDAFHTSPTGMGMARCRARTVPASRAPGICCGEQAQAVHEFSGVIAPGEVTQFSHGGDRHGALDTAPSLERVDHRVEAPRVDLCWACLCETLEPCGVVGDRSDLCLEDDWRSGCGTNDR